MKSIIFSKHPEKIQIPASSAVCVYHKAYMKCLPKVDNCVYVEFEHLCNTFQQNDYFADKDTVVFVGANKFFTPSTRFHPVFEILQYGLPGLKRYSIDIAPYIGPIWRLWAHFSFAGVPYGDYTYSYLLESHYNAYLDGAREDNPMAFNKIAQYAAGNVSIDYTRYFAEPSVRIVYLTEAVHREYQELKARLFDECSTITPIIRGLSRFASLHCRERHIPQEHRIFDFPDSIRIVRTDLKVDEYLTNKLLEKIAEVNKVVEVLHGD